MHVRRKCDIDDRFSRPILDAFGLASPSCCDQGSCRGRIKMILIARRKH